MKTVYVGMDLASKTVAAVAVDRRGKTVSRVEFETSAQNLIEFVKGLNAKVLVLFEEGEMAGWAYRVLLPHADVTVCEPRRNAWIYKGAKADPIDAAKLAELLRIKSFSPVLHTPDEDMAAFQLLVKRYDQVVKRASALKCQIKARLRSQGVVFDGTRVFGRKGREEALALVPHEAAREAIRMDFDLLDLMNQEVANARRLMSSHSKAFPVVKAFMEIPGCGPVTACRFVSCVHDPCRFASKSAFWRYCRLGVMVKESGGMKLCPDKLDKSGVGTLKDASRTIFNGAMRSNSDNGIKRSYRSSFTRTGNPVHARLNTQRKILWTMLQMWKRDEAYSDRRFAGA